MEFNFGAAGRRGNSADQLRPAPSVTLTDTGTIGGDTSDVGAESQVRWVADVMLGLPRLSSPLLLMVGLKLRWLA